MTTPNAWKSGNWTPYPDTTLALPEPADRIAWLLQRREGIGASDCPPILGFGRSHGDGTRDTQLDVWLDKTGQVPLSNASNEAMEWGHLLEPIICDRAAHRLGVESRQCAGLVSVDRPWQRASLDRVLLTDDGPIPLEAKNTSQWLAADWADGQVPDAAELQVQHQLSVTGAPYAYVAGLVGGNRLIVRRIERDQELIDHINTTEGAFWHDNVLGGVAPEVVSYQDTATMLGAIPDRDDPVLVLDSETDAERVVQLLGDYDAARTRELSGIEGKTEARNRLLWMAQGASEIQAPDGTTLVKFQRGVFAAKRFTEAHPEVADVTMHKIETLDVAAVKREHPELYRAFQAQSIRRPKRSKQ